MHVYSLSLLQIYIILKNETSLFLAYHNVKWNIYCDITINLLTIYYLSLFTTQLLYYLSLTKITRLEFQSFHDYPSLQDLVQAKSHSNVFKRINIQTALFHMSKKSPIHYALCRKYFSRQGKTGNNANENPEVFSTMLEKKKKTLLIFSPWNLNTFRKHIIPIPEIPLVLHSQLLLQPVSILPQSESEI